MGAAKVCTYGMCVDKDVEKMTEMARGIAKEKKRKMIGAQIAKPTTRKIPRQSSV
jgi:hypothetical protein